MLVDEQDGDVFSVMRVPVKGLLDDRGLGPGIDDEEVLLGVRGQCDVLCIFQRRQIPPKGYIVPQYLQAAGQ